MQWNRCMKCMREIESYPCPHCGYTSEEKRNDQALKPETILNGRYLIGCMMGQGGFGMTYVGWDLMLEQKVAVKEFYPSGHVIRDREDGSGLIWSATEQAGQMHEEGLENVLKEARKMAVVSEIPQVVSVKDTFFANDTAYIVMSFVEGDTLKKHIRDHGPLQWQDAEKIFLSAIEAMGQVHKAGLIHRDISPDNLMLTSSGKVKILDLGAAKDLNRNRGASSMLVAKKGFSPVEQYIERGNSGPWTDVYAMAATIWYTLTGTIPQEAIERSTVSDRMTFEHPNVPIHVGAALKKAMAIRPEDRTQSMELFLRDLKSVDIEAALPPAPVAASNGNTPPKPPKKAEPSKAGAPKNEKKKSPLLILPVLLAILAAAFAGIWAGYHVWTEGSCTESPVCKICGKPGPAATGHKWLAATCTEPRTCSVCGTQQGNTISHSWTAADCTEPKTCRNCGAVDGEALGHVWTDGDCETPRTCSRCGVTEGEAPGHAWQDGDCETPKTCSRCGAAEGAAPGHAWQDADCETPKTCSRCGKTEGRALGHAWQDGDCETPRTCSRCGVTEGAAPGHAWLNADCVTPKTCSRCGATEGEALGHDWQEASCTQPQTCARCSLTQGEPAGHVWVSANGSQSCSVCGRKRLTATAGSYVTFGSYEQDDNTANGAEPIEWLVLEVDGSRVLLLSRYGLDSQPYHTKNQNMTWADSFIRSWLNTEFLQQAFSPAEIDAILLTQVDNSASQGYSGFTTGGGVNTRDQIFLLSYAEANRYLSVRYTTESGSRDNMEARIAPTAYAIAKGANASNSPQTAFGEMTGWWWLRSPAKKQDQAVYVGVYGAFDNSELDDAHGSVRPALWIDLEKAVDLVKTPVDPYRPDFAAGSGSGSDAAGSASVSSDTTLEDMICKRIGHLWNSETPRVCMVCGTVEDAESASGTAASSGQSASAVTAGSYLTFGSYEQDNNTSNGAEPIEWLVLEVRGDRALVISRYSLDARHYDEQWRELTWEVCSLRSWLNHDFLDAAFTTQEQSAILTTEVDNSSSQCFDFVEACGWAEPVRGGNNTRDKLFLLSYGEANRYMNVVYSFGDNMDARCAPTAYAVARGAEISAGNKTRDGLPSADWWLRSPGIDQRFAAFVLSSGQLTHLNYVVQTYYAGVRPAMWIKLN